MRHAADAAPRVAAVVLAAGASRRMGAENKLLAPIDGVPMLARVVDAALASRAEPVRVVTGHDAVAVERSLAGRAVEFVHNPAHRDGLSTSLAAGLASLAADCDAALVCLGDMPWVESAVLDSLIDAFARDAARPICLPEHAGARGNPALWPARHFPALRALEGDVGGRVLLERYANEVRQVAVPDDGVHRDVDTPEDLSEANRRA